MAVLRVRGPLRPAPPPGQFAPEAAPGAGGFFFKKFPSEKKYLLIETSSADEQALSAVVERPTVIPKVVGSNPGQFFFFAPVGKRLMPCWRHVSVCLFAGGFSAVCAARSLAGLQTAAARFFL